MKTPAEWNRSYTEMKRSDFVRIPAYDMEILTTPMKTLLKERNDPETIRALTAKLFYSTRFFGTYDLDQGEFTGDHAGIDLKVPEGTPVASIAGGRISSVIRDASGLGLHVIIEHRLGEETFYSIYGHLSAVSVREGQDVAPGQMIALSGSTGRSTAAHLHLQIDRGEPGEIAHEPYWPGDVPTKTEAARHTVNPVTFIAAHAR
jgi:murein DD-endopeptidase MepM/ murein hydrolase activator NlpD